MEQIVQVRRVDPFDFHQMSNMREFARELSLSVVLCPEAMRKNPGDMLLAMMIAKDSNLPLVFVLQGINVIKGKASFSTQFMIALANASGRFRGPIRYDVEHEGTPQLAVTAWALLADGGDRVSYRVPLSLAVEDGWVARNPKYKTMPAHMLRFRAAAFLIRMYAPDVLLGFHEEGEVVDNGLADKSEVIRLAATQGSSSTAPTSHQSSSLPLNSTPAQVVDAVELTPDPDQEERDALIMDIRTWGVTIDGTKKEAIMKKLGIKSLNGGTPLDTVRLLHQEIMVLRMDQEHEEELKKQDSELGLEGDGQPPEFRRKASDPDARPGNGTPITLPPAQVATDLPPEPTEAKEAKEAKAPAKGPAPGPTSGSVEAKQSNIDAGIVANSACFKAMPPDGYSVDAFRAMVRAALNVQRIAEQRFQSLLKAGAALGHWHGAMHGTTPWVKAGRKEDRPAPAPAKVAGEQKMAETARGAVAFESAGLELEEQVGDWELKLDQVMDTLSTDGEDRRLIVAKLRKAAGVTPHNLGDQPKALVLKYRDLLKAKAEELAE